MMRSVRLVVLLVSVVTAIVLVAVAMLLVKSAGRETLTNQQAALAGAMSRQTIQTIDLECRIDFPRDKPPSLNCVCKLRANSSGDDLTFLLNPGLTISEILVDDKPAPYRRRGEVITVKHTATDVRATIVYAGSIAPSGIAAPYAAHDILAASFASFWHPLDLHSFFEFKASLNVPENVTVACVRSSRDVSEDGRRVVAWHEPRPVLGAMLAVGPFRRTERIHGEASCAVYAQQDLADEHLDAMFDALGRSYNMLEAILGDDGFRGVAAVLLPGTQEWRAFESSNSVITLSEDEMRSTAATVAPLIAQNWWGGTVTAPWFVTRPDGSVWINRGLAEYSAWLAMERLYGTSAVLRHKARYKGPLTISHPLRIDTLLSAGSDTASSQDTYPYIASMLGATIGPTNVVAAMRQILTTYRYREVSNAQAEEVFSQVSEQDLDEFMRVWFDRPGHFDYAVAGLSQEGDQVRVTIVNRGNNPAFAPLPILLETSTGTEVRTIDVGTRGGEVTLTSSQPVRRVVLDPEWLTPDTDRSNNIWPRRSWMVSVSVGDRSRLCMLEVSSWRHDLATDATILSWNQDTHAFDALPLDSVPTRGPMWVRDAGTIAYRTFNSFQWRPGALPERYDALPGAMTVHENRMWDNPSGTHIAESTELGDMVIRDRSTQRVQRVSLEGPVIDASWEDDRYLVILVSEPVGGFATVYHGYPDVFRVDSLTGSTVPWDVDMSEALRETIDDLPVGEPKT